MHFLSFDRYNNGMGNKEKIEISDGRFCNTVFEQER